MFQSLIPAAALDMLIRTAEATPPGPWIEVGVYQGGSALRLYKARVDHELHLFDTFTGIPVNDPTKGDHHKVGEFNSGNILLALSRHMPEAHFHIGLFPDTLPDDLCRIAFAHIDCDQYSSISSCITNIWPRMAPNGIMWFDDFSFLAGARRAVLEHFTEQDLHHAADDRRFVIK